MVVAVGRIFILEDVVSGAAIHRNATYGTKRCDEQQGKSTVELAYGGRVPMAAIFILRILLFPSPRANLYQASVRF